MENLTQEQIDQLLEAETLEELQQLAQQFGINLADDPVNWTTQDLLYEATFVKDRYEQFIERNEEISGSLDIDGDGRVSTSEIDAATADTLQTEGEDAALATAEAGASRLNAPRWVLDRFNNGQNLSPAQQQRILRDVNFEHGTAFTNWNQLLESGFLDQQTAVTQQIVEYAILDQDPIEAFQVSYGNGQKFAIEAEEFATAMDSYGVDQRDLMHMVRVADRIGLVNDVAGVARPSWQIALALAKATGSLERLKSPTQPNRPLADFNTVIEQTESGNLPPLPDEFSDLDAGVITTKDRYQNLSDNILRGEMNQGTALDPRRETLSFRDLGAKFNEGLERYRGDPLIAFLHSVDPGLASRLAYSGGDITKIRGMDVYEARGILSNAGFAGFGQFQQTMMQMGYGEAEKAGFDNIWGYLAAIDEQEQGSRNLPAGPSEPTPRFPDPVGLDETIRSLYQQLFFEEPDDATLERFRSQINGAVQHAFDNDISSVDITARAREFLRQTPQYEEFYSNKPEGLSEEEYAAQMQYAQQSMLGNELAGNKSAREGLRTGKYQTAVGAAAGTAEAWDNSTFLGRLARAGEVVGRNT